MAPSHRRFAVMLSCATLLALAIAPTRAEDAKSRRRVLLSMYGIAPDLGDAPLWKVPHALGFYGSALAVPTTAGIKTLDQLRGAKWGSQSQAMCNEVQDNDRKTGLISATRPVEDCFTSRFERQANDSDAEAVRRQAKSFTDAMIRYPSR